MIVVFTKTNARIVQGEQEFDRAFPHVENPRLGRVKGVAPHFWKLENGEVVPMTLEEQQERKKAIGEEKVHNHISLRDVPKIEPIVRVEAPIELEEPKDLPKPIPYLGQPLTRLQFLILNLLALVTLTLAKRYL